MTEKNRVLSLIAAAIAKNDQQIEAAKDWLGRTSVDPDQFMTIWKHLNQEFESPIDEVTSQFALIGLVHVAGELLSEQVQQAP